MCKLIGHDDPHSHSKDTPYMTLEGPCIIVAIYIQSNESD